MADRNDELLPCPFCGGEAKVRGRNVFPLVAFYHVACLSCWATSQRVEKEQVATKAWNTRSKEADNG